MLEIDIFDKIKIIKIIDKGIFGTIFLVENTQDIQERYALKIQKINESDIKENYSSKVWREIDFAKYVSQYQNQFWELSSFYIRFGMFDKGIIQFFFDSDATS